MAATTVKVEGLAELEAMMKVELARATSKNVLKRAATIALQPVADAMRAKAPDDPRTHGNDLKASIKVSDKLSPRQASLNRGPGPTRTATGWKSDPKSSVTVYAGAGPLPQAHMTEYGTEHSAPEPWARPAWDSQKNAILPRLVPTIKAEIDKAVARKAKRAARR